MTQRVYLAGPMTGLSGHDAGSWREEIKTLLDYCPAGTLELLDPCRNSGVAGQTKYLAEGNIDPTAALTNPRAQRTRNLFDISRASLIFCNFLGAQRISVGTVYELGYAAALGKPTIIVIEPSGNVHEHLMTSPGFECRVNSIDDGLDMLKSFLLLPHDTNED